MSKYFNDIIFLLVSRSKSICISGEKESENLIRKKIHDRKERQINAERKEEIRKEKIVQFCYQGEFHIKNLLKKKTEKNKRENR